jgi:acyl transferase domain-containing protein
MPDAKTLRTLLARFADARLAHTRQSRPGTEEELRDIAYTLCVMTGTREVREALAVADQLLARAELPAAPAAAERSREDLPMAA